MHGKRRRGAVKGGAILCFAPDIYGKGGMDDGAGETVGGKAENMG